MREIDIEAYGGPELEEVDSEEITDALIETLKEFGAEAVRVNEWMGETKYWKDDDY